MINKKTLTLSCLLLLNMHIITGPLGFGIAEQDLAYTLFERLDQQAYAADIEPTQLAREIETKCTERGYYKKIVTLHLMDLVDKKITDYEELLSQPINYRWNIIWIGVGTLGLCTTAARALLKKILFKKCSINYIKVMSFTSLILFEFYQIMYKKNAREKLNKFRKIKEILAKVFVAQKY